MGFLLVDGKYILYTPSTSSIPSASPTPPPTLTPLPSPTPLPSLILPPSSIPSRPFSINITELPAELLLLIGRQVRRIQDLINLRLACKLFDNIFAPIVLSHVHVRGHPHPEGVSVRDLARRYELSAFVKSMTVYSLGWMVFQPEGFRDRCWTALNHLCLVPTRSFPYVRFVKDTVSRNNELGSLQGNRYLEELQNCIFPNLESVKWYTYIDGLNTSSILFLKFLVLLPSLKELDLSLKLWNIVDLNSYMDLLTQVSGLRKLTLRLSRGHRASHPSYIRWFGRLIANNPNLAYLHLSWHDEADSSPLQAFHYVPVDRPAQLKELLLNITVITNELDLIPHLRSLQSLDIRWTQPRPEFWAMLALNSISISCLTVGAIDKALCDYLLFNKNLVSFTIATSAHRSQNSSHLLGPLSLFRALEDTNVAQITISPSDWAEWYANAEIEGCFRRYVKLQRITLLFENGRRPTYTNIRATTKTVSRLGGKTSLEISGDDYIRRGFRKCCQSKDPLMRSLQQRLVFLEPQD